MVCLLEVAEGQEDQTSGRETTLLLGGRECGHLGGDQQGVGSDPPRGGPSNDYKGLQASPPQYPSKRGGAGEHFERSGEVDFKDVSPLRP